VTLRNTAAAAAADVCPPTGARFDDLSSWMSKLNKVVGSTSFAAGNLDNLDAAATDWTPTCLVGVSPHSVLRRAESVVLKAGSVEAVGQLEELLETCRDAAIVARRCGLVHRLQAVSSIFFFPE